ncbi:YbaB/EbfC family nucleoid-associated protein [Amycolatopsis vancoresmycina]|uniref:YbaB/EbfC family nucleoid-associated protein n=1 Tax=Amycolatopsis vancoresmycina TaxID=208444 RepID=UPI00068FBE8F|nr:YbaB/EbfC family nucleoid-associated protein [Amycolatopsis vancoresmycina]
MTGYGERLAAIRASAADGGVTVVVDLHGALVDLRFERRALTRSPHELAELIRRLAAEAGTDALQQGQEVLGDLLPSGSAEQPEARSRHAEPDSLLPATWAT